MRVTQNMLNNTMLRNLYKSNEAMDKYQNQLSSGKKINKPSDDPAVAVKGMYYRSALVEIEQYKENISDARNWLDTTDLSMQEANDVLQRARELTIQGSNGVLTKEEKEAIAQEILQLKDQLGTIANTSVAGRFIFAGTDTKIPPYNHGSNIVDGAWVNNNQQDILTEVSKQVYLPINVNGNLIFNYQNSDGENIFQVFDHLYRSLTETPEPSTSVVTPTDDMIGKLDEQIDNFLAQQAALGARVNRIELAANRLEQQEVNTTALISQAEDADMAKVIINLKNQENVQRSALSAGARIIQPTLIDFLR